MVDFSSTGTHARAVPKSELQGKWEESVDKFWEYVNKVATTADDFVDQIKGSQVSKELDGLITDTMGELNIYADDLQNKLAPFTQDAAAKFGRDVAALRGKLQGDMDEVKGKMAQYAEELRLMVGQNAEEVRSRISMYTRKLKKRLNKDTEELRRREVLKIALHDGQSSECPPRHGDVIIAESAPQDVTLTERFNNFQTKVETLTQDLTEKTKAAVEELHNSEFSMNASKHRLTDLTVNAAYWKCIIARYNITWALSAVLALNASSPIALSGVESFRLQKRDAEPTAPPSAWGNSVTDTLWDYWGKGTALANSWIEDVKSWKVDEKVINLYTESAAAIETYTGILKDQIYHSWNQQ
ncbi:UNVERIFIED_CONTAM: hypothetical protein FKN15_035876 [Acipenser sinensis]